MTSFAAGLANAFFEMRRRHAVVLLILAFVAIFPHPSLWSGKLASDATDTYFFSWLMSHHWRQWLGTGFTSYFETGILTPFPKTLLFSEFGIVHAILGWPVYAFTGNTFAAYCFVNVFGLALTAAAMFQFAFKVFKNNGVALWTSFVFTFSAYQMIHLNGHLQMACGFVFPFAFYSVLMLQESGRKRWVAALALIWTVSFYFNVYYFVFLSYSIPAWALYLALKNRRTLKPMAIGTLTALCLTGASVGWLALRYYAVKETFPNIAFPPSARVPLQLDYASLFRSSPGLLLGQDKGVSENVSYLGIGLIALCLTYFGIRLDRRTQAHDRRYISFTSPAFLVFSLVAFAFLGVLTLNLEPPILKLLGVKLLGSIAYLAVLIAVVVYVRRRRKSESASTHSGFFLLFAAFWFFVGLGNGFFSGVQPFNWFLEYAPLLSGLRAVGRLAVLVSFGMVMFSGHILLHLRSSLQVAGFSHRKLALLGLATALIFGTGELLYGSIRKVTDSLHDPTEFVTAARAPKAVEFYQSFSREFPEAAVYELPTRSWGDQLRVYQFGSSFRDTLRRFQGLTGFTPAFFTKTIGHLAQEDADQSEDWSMVSELLLQLPVRFFIAHLDGAVKTSPRILEFLRNDSSFKLVRSVAGSSGETIIEVFEKQNATLENFGLVTHPIVSLAMRDFLSVPAVENSNGEIEIPCPGRCRFSMLWPYSRLAASSVLPIVEVGDTSKTATLKLQFAKSPTEDRLEFEVENPTSSVLTLKAVYLNTTP